MTKNMGNADKIIRTAVAAIVFLLILTGSLEGTWAWILGIFAVVFLVTSAIGFCPIYTALKFSTIKALPGGKK